MAFSTACYDNSGGYENRRLSGNALPQRLFGGAGLVCVALLCTWTLWANLGGTAADGVSRVQPRPSPAAYAALSAALKAYANRSAAANRAASRSTPSDSFARLFDSPEAMGFPPGTFEKSAVIAALVPDDGKTAPGQSTIAKTQDVVTTASIGDQTVQHLAPSQQQLRSTPIRTASVAEASHANPVAPDAPPRKQSIFERLFGKPAPVTLAYASPDDGMPGGQGFTTGRYDRWTAVYDISAHTVYLPDGTKLEAHSGLGSRLDDPRHADERMRGPTPPAVYDLEPREGLFHGVRALRLIPANDEKVFGRSGLLAHTYMLGPNGDSNGCVSFRNYGAFLNAYLKHEIKRLVVVARLS